MYPPAIPSLPFELIESLLSTSIRLNLASQPLRDYASTATRFGCILHALPRTTIPEVSRVLLFQLPWTSLDLAARLGNVWMLDTMVHWYPRIPLQCTTNWLVGAAEAGHESVFEWWNARRNQALPIQCDVSGILDAASKHGQVDILRWWRAYVLDPLEEQGKLVKGEHYSVKAVDGASAGGHLACLNWWLHESGMPVKFTRSALQSALSNAHHAVLDWWAQSGLDFKAGVSGSEKLTLVATALKNKDLRGFQWLVAHDLASFSNMTALCSLANDEGMVFFKACATIVACTPLSSCTSLTRAHLPDPPAYELATQAGRVDMLNHLCTLHRLPDRKTILHYFKVASELGHPCVLQWWLDKGTARGVLKFDSTISKLVHVAAAEHGHTNVLDWWSTHAIKTFASLSTPTPTPPLSMTPGGTRKSGVFILDFDAVNKAAAKGQLAVLQWFWSWAGRHSQPRAYGTIKKGHVCYYALVGGHADVIRWAATKRGFATIPTAKVADAMALAAKQGSWEAIQAYVEGFCQVVVHVRIVGAEVDVDEDKAADGSAQDKDQQALAWWKHIPELSGSSSSHWISQSLISASRRGDLTTLNWWMAQAVAPQISASSLQKAMAAASLRGHVDCLDWWCLVGARMLRHGLIGQLAFASNDVFASDEPVDCFVLAWWMASPFRFSDNAIHLYTMLVRFGQVRLLDKAMAEWDKLGRVQVPPELINMYHLAASHGQVAVLDWWHCRRRQQVQQKDSDLTNVFRRMLLAASARAYLCVLDWWKHSSGVASPDHVPFSASQVVSKLSHLPKVLNWWLESGLLPDGHVDANDDDDDDSDQDEDDGDGSDHYDEYGDPYDDYGNFDGNDMFDEWCDMMYETSLGWGHYFGW